MTSWRRVKPTRATAAAAGAPLRLPRPGPRAPRRPGRPPGKPQARAGPAEVASAAPPPPRPVRASSFIFGGHPEALQRVGLGARAVLPGDVHLQVAERVVGLEVERLAAQALVRPERSRARPPLLGARPGRRPSSRRFIGWRLPRGSYRGADRAPRSGGALFDRAGPR